MMIQNPFELGFAVLLPFLLAGGFKPVAKEVLPWDVSGALARVGYGLGKGWLMWAIFWNVYYVSVTAADGAVTGWSAFLGMVSFWLSFYLLVSGSFDILAGLSRLGRRQLPEIIHRPFWSDGFVLFWNRWGVRAAGTEPTVKAALIRVSLFFAAVIFFSGFRPVMILWLVLQAALILLDWKLGRVAWWRDRLPFWIKNVLIAVLFLLSSVLLYSQNLGEALNQWGRLFSPLNPSIYALFLDARLTSPAVCGWLWIGVMIILALPDFSWWMGQGKHLRRLAKTGGLLLVLMSVFLALPYVTSSAGALNEASVHLRLWLDPEGSTFVKRGADGWLYSRHELDRLTQKRMQPGFEPEVLQLQTRLQAAGAHLLVIPVPGKISLRPEPILPAKYQGAVYPPGYHDSLKRLKEAGVDVFDLTDKLWDRRNLMPLYFEQDSHWRWEAMKELTVQVSRHIRQKYPQVVKDETPLVDAVFMERQDLGDLAKGLTSWEPERFWRAESTQMVGLRGLTGADASPVLVVGGSLIQVYDSSSLSFAPASETDAPAGFPTQLGALLGRGLEVVDERYFPEVEKKAVGKKLVIWVVRAGEL